ncbi:MAG: RHS repeat-associated core domain-containing protein [Ardenticatenales bacterium]|nr:RHS repeat-associated core domain-containing protein [Ardenticatenales bacterium]
MKWSALVKWNLKSGLGIAWAILFLKRNFLCNILTNGWVAIDDVTLSAPLSETRYYYAGAQRIAQRIESRPPVWTIGDHLGSTSFSIDSANTVSELRYKPWGATRYESGTTPTERRYTGQIQDAADIYFYNARYYDPTLGKFLQADTIVPEPGNPQSFNRYSYVLNNPLRYTDPTGHFTEDAIKEYLYSTYLEAEAERILAEWQSDEAWWEMMLDAEAGDTLLVATAASGYAAYSFVGEGKTKLTGLKALDSTGGNIRGASVQKGLLAQVQSGRSSERDPNTNGLSWAGKFRQSGNHLDILMAPGYNYAVGYWTDYHRRNLYIAEVAAAGVGGLWVGSAAATVGAGTKLQAALEVVFAVDVGYHGTGIHDTLVDTLGMNPNDKWVYVYPQDTTFKPGYGWIPSNHFLYVHRGTVSVR